MVFINSKKFACESCIKGHRSSSCHHNDRPLFEIKKKGRPVSQCEKCREARQARRIHAKCTCDADNSKSAALVSSSSQPVPKKGKRFIPTVPALPNGLKDALKLPSVVSSTPIDPSSTRSQVDALLNPCHCADVRNCKCRYQSNPDASGSRAPNALMVSQSVYSSGLSALAAAAACCSPAPHASVNLPPVSSIASTKGDDKKRPHSGCHRQPKSSRNSLAPIVSASPSGSSLARYVPPANDVYRLPPTFSRASTSTVTILSPSSADDDCCCGHRCECAGCSKHDDRAKSLASPSSTNRSFHPEACGQDCPTCVDHRGGVELPVPGQPRPSTFLDEFFARAATLPSPPPQSGRSTALDPTNVTVYPPGLFANRDSSFGEKRGLAFGLVQVPKLECCGGKCSCPEDSCGCGDECGGCCD